MINLFSDSTCTYVVNLPATYASCRLLFIKCFVACPYGWVRGLTTSTSCYKILTYQVQWHEALTRCEKIGGYLINLETVEEMVWLRGYRTMHYTPVWNFWVGGALTDSGWMWIEQSGSQIPITDDNWSSGQPDNKLGNQTCLALFGYKKTSIVRFMEFDDEDCNKQYRFICETDI